MKKEYVQEMFEDKVGGPHGPSPIRKSVDSRGQPHFVTARALNRLLIVMRRFIC